MDFFFKSSLQYVYDSRKLADKDAEELIRGCEFEAYAMAKIENIEDEEMLKAFIRKSLAAHLDSLPFEIIQENIERRKRCYIQSK